MIIRIQIHYTSNLGGWFLIILIVTLPQYLLKQIHVWGDGSWYDEENKSYRKFL